VVLGAGHATGWPNGKEKHYQMGMKMINIGLKTQNQSTKQNPTTFSGGK